VADNVASAVEKQIEMFAQMREGGEGAKQCRLRRA